MRVDGTMELNWLNTICNCVLLSGFTLCFVFGPQPSLGVDIISPAELVIENGTSGVLKCSFWSKEVVSSAVTVSWNFQQSGSDKPPSTIFYYGNGKAFPGTEFKERLVFVGDLNKKDASIQLSQAQFSDNGTYFCDVKNPPDISGTPSRTVLKVVLKESLPQDNTPLIVGVVCVSIVALVILAVFGALCLKRHHDRNDYEGCTSVESISSHAPQPRKKVEAILEGSTRSSPTGPLQGPVIYAQLDHSGTKSPTSFHKEQPVVYADIRKN